MFLILSYKYLKYFTLITTYGLSSPIVDILYILRWRLFYRYINRYIIYKLYYRKIFNPIVLIIIDIIFEILFDSLIESFYLFIDLKVKDYKKFVVYFKFYYKYYKELWNKSYIFICYKFIWQSIIINNLLDYNIYEIFYWMGFVGRNKFAIFGKTFYNNKDIVIINIINKVLLSSPRFVRYTYPQAAESSPRTGI